MKETLERAACIALGYEYDYWLKLHSKDQSSLVYIEVTNWCKGAKWQSERMYSEEDLEEAFKSGFTNCYNNNNLTFGEWFEQFKKK